MTRTPNFTLGLSLRVCGLPRGIGSQSVGGARVYFHHMPAAAAAVAAGDTIAALSNGKRFSLARIAFGLYSSARDGRRRHVEG